MAGQKVSRKALKTKNQIGTVLAELLQEKELRDITVHEIAEKADVSCRKKKNSIQRKSLLP